MKNTSTLWGHSSFYISVIIISKVAKNQQWWLWYVIYRYAVFRLINIPVSVILHSNPEPKGSCSKTSLQFVIKNCTDLTVLWLQHLYNLVHVDLSYNSLKVLEAAHTRLGNIKTLSLAGNQLDQLTGLTKLYSLVNLDLSHNQLAQVITLWMSRWSRCPSDVDAFKDIFFFRLYCKECKRHFPHIFFVFKESHWLSILMANTPHVSLSSIFCHLSTVDSPMHTLNQLNTVKKNIRP